MFVESSGTSKNETLLKVQKRDRKGVQIPTMQKVVRHDDLDIKLHLFQRPHREDILGLIRSLIPKFVRRVAQRTFQKRDDFECQIVPFGSYGLGAHTAGADMDLIFLGAWPVERRDFRYLFTSMLRAQPGVTDVDASSLTIKLCACVCRVCLTIYFCPIGNYADEGAHHQMQHLWHTGKCRETKALGSWLLTMTAV